LPREVFALDEVSLHGVLVLMVLGGPPAVGALELVRGRHHPARRLVHRRRRRVDGRVDVLGGRRPVFAAAPEFRGRCGRRGRRVVGVLVPVLRPGQ